MTNYFLLFSFWYFLLTASYVFFSSYLPPAPTQSSGVVFAAPCCLVWAHGRKGRACCISSRLSCSSFHWYREHGPSHHTVGTPDPSQPAPESQGSDKGARTATGRAWSRATTQPQSTIYSPLMNLHNSTVRPGPCKGTGGVGGRKWWSVNGSSQASPKKSNNFSQKLFLCLWLFLHAFSLLTQRQKRSTVRPGR